MDFNNEHQDNRNLSTSPTKFNAAVQIIRPKQNFLTSQSKQDSPSRIKVTKLVLKKSPPKSPKSATKSTTLIINYPTSPVSYTKSILNELQATDHSIADGGPKEEVNENEKKSSVLEPTGGGLDQSLKFQQQKTDLAKITNELSDYLNESMKKEEEKYEKRLSLAEEIALSEQINKTRVILTGPESDSLSADSGKKTYDIIDNNLLDDSPRKTIMEARIQNEEALKVLGKSSQISADFENRTEETVPVKVASGSPDTKTTTSRKQSVNNSANTKSATEVTNSEKKKEKPYDPDAAREFMKKQREKRKSEMKSADSTDKDLIKQRLEALKKNTRKIVDRNVSKAKSRSASSTPKKMQPLKKSDTVPDLKPPPVATRRERSQENLKKSVTVKDKFDRKVDGAKIEKQILESNKGKKSPKSPKKEVKTSKQKEADILKELLSGGKKIGIQRQPGDFSVLSPDGFTPLLGDKLNIFLKDLEEREEAKKKANMPPVETPPTVVEKKPEIPPQILMTPIVQPTTHSPKNTSRTITETKKSQRAHIPYWLKNSAVRPYPYNFIWAVRKKLDAFTKEAEKQKMKAAAVSKPTPIPRKQEIKSFETPRTHLNQQVVKKKLLEKVDHEKKNRFSDFLMDKYINNPVDTPKIDLKKAIGTQNDSETNANTSSFQDPDGNTISEISSIKSDAVNPITSTRIEVEKNVETNQSEDDTTINEINESIMQSTPESTPVKHGKLVEEDHDERLYITLHRGSFVPPQKYEDSMNHKTTNDNISHFSLNNSDKRNDFLKSTKVSWDDIQMKAPEPERLKIIENLKTTPKQGSSSQPSNMTHKSSNILENPRKSSEFPFSLNSVQDASDYLASFPDAADGATDIQESPQKRPQSAFKRPQNIVNYDQEVTKSSEKLQNIPAMNSKRNLSTITEIQDEDKENQDKNSVPDKEVEYQKMLDAFNKSLSHVIEVNQMLYTALSEKSSSTKKSSSIGSSSNFQQSFSSSKSIISSYNNNDNDLAAGKSNPAASEYSSTFESNVETENTGRDVKDSTTSKISEALELLEEGHDQSSSDSDVEETRKQNSVIAGRKKMNVEKSLSDSNSIRTLILENEEIDDEKSFTVKYKENSGTMKNFHENNLNVLKENQQNNFPTKEFSTATITTKTTTTTTKIHHQNILNEDMTADDSEVLAVLNCTDTEISFNATMVTDLNCSYSSIGMVDQMIKTETQKSDVLTMQIKNREKYLIDRTKGQIAWLELQKQKYKKKGMIEKITEIKKKQRAILVRLEKERSDMKKMTFEQPSISNNNNNRSLTDNLNNSNLNLKKSLTPKTVEKSVEPMKGYDMHAGESIEKILQRREMELQQRRQHVEYLMQWQKKLDMEEQQIIEMEKMLLGANLTKISGKENVIVDEIDNLNLIKRSRSITSGKESEERKSLDSSTSAQRKKLKKIEKSLKLLQNISSTTINTEEDETDEYVDASGSDLNKLWMRLTGRHFEKFEPGKMYNLNKGDLETLYEDAKRAVLEDFEEDRDVKKLFKSPPKMDKTKSPRKPVAVEEDKKTLEKSVENASEVSTMNSIENLVTEEDSAAKNSEVEVVESEEVSANAFDTQIKVFMKPQEPPIKDSNESPEKPTMDLSPPKDEITDTSPSRTVSFNDSEIGVDQQSTPQSETKSTTMKDDVAGLFKICDVSEIYKENEIINVKDQEPENLSNEQASVSNVSDDFQSKTYVVNRKSLENENSGKLERLSNISEELEISDTVVPEIVDIPKSGSISTDISFNSESIHEIEDDVKIVEKIDRLEDISFPNFESTINDSTRLDFEEEIPEMKSLSEDVRSSIDYDEENSRSERRNSELEKRLASVHDSLEELSEIFEKVPIIHSSKSASQSPDFSSGSSTLTYSTDKDFKDESKKTSPENEVSAKTNKSEKSGDEHSPKIVDMLEKSPESLKSTESTVKSESSLKSEEEAKSSKSEISERLESLQKSSESSENSEGKSESQKEFVKFINSSINKTISTTVQTDALAIPSTSKMLTGVTMPDIISEAEVLRRQQLVIEQEIKELEQQVPYIFKLPPPYKEQPSKDSPVTLVIPSDEKITAIVNEKLDQLYAGNDQVAKVKITNVYERIINDMCQEYFEELKEPDMSPPSYMKESNYKNLIFYSTKDKRKCLQDYIMKKIQKILIIPTKMNQQQLQQNSQLFPMGHLPLAGTQLRPFHFYMNSINYCNSRRKRDNVDEILISELVEDENKWLFFEKEESEIKNNLTGDILDWILEDALQDMQAAFKKKYKLEDPVPEPSPTITEVSEKSEKSDILEESTISEHISTFDDITPSISSPSHHI